jgi:hypothetical protein
MWTLVRATVVVQLWDIVYGEGQGMSGNEAFKKSTLDTEFFTCVDEIALQHPHLKEMYSHLPWQAEDEPKLDKCQISVAP